MPPRKQAYRRHEAVAKPRRSPPADGRFKTTGVTEDDIIRIRSKVGTGVFRDGMTVGAFLRAVPRRDDGLRLLASCVRGELIGFEQGTIEDELEAALADLAP